MASTAEVISYLESSRPRNRVTLLLLDWKLSWCGAHPAVGHTSTATNNTTLTRDFSITMAPIDEANAFSRSSSEPNISEATRMFEVEKSVLSKHFYGKTVSIAKANETKQLLTNKQEVVLVDEIQKLCD
jgi:hypothetical protein